MGKGRSWGPSPGLPSPLRCQGVALMALGHLKVQQDAQGLALLVWTHRRESFIISRCPRKSGSTKRALQGLGLPWGPGCCCAGACGRNGSGNE